MTRRQAYLSRVVLDKIGMLLRAEYAIRTTPTNPRLDVLALIVDAQRRNDPYLKGTRYEPPQQA